MQKEIGMLMDDNSLEISHNRHRLYNHHHDHHFHGDMYDNGSPLNHHHHHHHHRMYSCASSPHSVFSLTSNGSSSSLFSVGHSFPDNGSPTPPSLEEFKSHMPIRTPHNPKIPDSPIRNNYNTNERLIDELSLRTNLGKMYISDEQLDASSFIELGNGSSIGNNRGNVDVLSFCKSFNGEFSDDTGFQSPVTGNAASFKGQMSPKLLGLQQDYRMGNPLDLQFAPAARGALSSEFDYFNGPMSSPWQNMKEQTSNHHQIGSPLASRATTFSGAADALFRLQANVMNLPEDRVLMNFPNSEQVTRIRPPHSSVESLMYGPLATNGTTRASYSGIRVPQGHPKAFYTGEDSFITHGEGINYIVNPCHNRCTARDIGASLDRSRQDGRRRITEIYENSRSPRMCLPFFLPSKCNSLADARGYIGLLAKDQHGCRFLQRILDEGPREDVKIIFDEIIGNAVELMMNPFGNYLMQKLLDVCNEEQRTQILLVVTAKPGEFVRISLNTHGTRSVQKLVETLKTRHQVSRLVSALEPGFIALIKDLNGNHVVQRCLQCLSNEDNKFIFDGAAKNCVSIATHQHGCCVLQRCIHHSTGEHRENLVSEISDNALLLAEDAYGNYVVQFILDLRNPSATSTIVSQLKGNYVCLSTQKFSSHVVEKCLETFDDENRSTIIHELLSARPFEDLLQDPHANYVIQKALKVSQGHLRNSLVEAIEPHKAVSRNSPYSKRIFSQKLLKK
ncbi:Putative pumilio-7-like protein [Morus notabilis]|uniref:Putative pumilio-7-like protein n=1 Tax=Morus notabilis TaxID=981085 RepID=W9RHW9_9ROSA|nr:pumilio homolog 9 [Morus notabilis]EXB55300.1 Putative pumilio-7-like protein [Morus notabilis]